MYLCFRALYTYWYHADDKSQQTTLSFDNFENKADNYYVTVRNTRMSYWYHPTSTTMIGNGNVTFRTFAIAAIEVNSEKVMTQGEKQGQTCEIHFTMLHYEAQQVGVVHFYWVTKIMGLLCHLWWMFESRNVLTTSTCRSRTGHMDLGCNRWAQISDFHKLTVQDNASRLYLQPTVCAFQDQGPFSVSCSE